MLTIKDIRDLRKYFNEYGEVLSADDIFDTLEKALVVVEAAKRYRSEAANPVPDLAFRARCRNDLFEALKPFLEGGDGL